MDNQYLYSYNNNNNNNNSNNNNLNFNDENINTINNNNYNSNHSNHMANDRYKNMPPPPPPQHTMINSHYYQYNNHSNSSNGSNVNIPFGWISNMTQLSDPINEVPLPIIRQDSSLYLIDSSNLTTTVNLLNSVNNNNNTMESSRDGFDANSSKTLLDSINQMIDNTNVSNIRIRADLPKNQAEQSPLLRNIYQHVPAIIDKDYQTILPQQLLDTMTNIINNQSTSATTTNANDSQFISDSNIFEVMEERENNFIIPYKSHLDIFPQQQQHHQEDHQQPQDIKSATASTKSTTTTIKPPREKKERKRKKKQTDEEEQQAGESNETPIQKIFNEILELFEKIKLDLRKNIYNTGLIENLGKELLSCSKLGLLKDIPIEKYAHIIQFLIKFSREGLNTSLSYNSKDKNFALYYQRVEFSLECSLLAFTILTLPEIGNEIVQLLEDQLGEIFTSIKYNVFENIIGVLDPSFKTFKATEEKKQSTATSTTTKKKRKSIDTELDDSEDEVVDEEKQKDGQEDDDDESDMDNQQDDDDDDDDDDDGGVKKRSASKKKSIIKKKSLFSSKKEENKYTNLCNKVSEIFERISCVFESGKVSLQESFIEMVLDGSLPSLFVDGLTFVQLSCIKMVRGAFSMYPKFRQTIVDEILANLSKPILGANNKKIPKHYKVTKDRSIQILSALLIQMVQSAATLPHLDSVAATSNSTDTQDSTSNSTNKFSLSECQKYATCIILFFIEKCSEKTEEGEWKTLLENFIQDLLTVLNLPEWPAASLILRLFGATAMHIVSQQKVENNFRMISIDLLGNILTKLKQEIANARLEDSLLLLNSLDTPIAATTSSTSLTQPTKVKCVCKKYCADSFTVKCDHCDELFHDLCAPSYTADHQGGAGASNTMHQWTCITCRVKTQIGDYSNSAKVTYISNDTGPSVPTLPKHLSEKKKRRKSEEGNGGSTSPASTPLVVHEKDVYQQIILNYLSTKCSTEVWVNSSKQFLIGSWNDSNVQQQQQQQQQHEIVRRHLISQWNNNQVNSKHFICTDDEAIKVFRKLAVRGSVFLIINNLLHHLLSILFDQSIKARAKAMKAFSTIVEADPSVLADEQVHRAIRNRFIDESISVREHTVELIGKYVLIKPELTWRYIDLICDRISDKGISVRKRVVKTLHDICLAQPNHPKIPEICKVLVTRITDDDAIRDLALKTFQDLWFSDTKLESAAGGGDQHPTDGAESKQELTKVRQIIEVSKYLDNDAWIVDLINKMINKDTAIGVAKKDSKKKLEKEQNEINSMCSKICSTLIEMIVSMEEKRVPKNNAQYIGIFKTLYIFCKVKPSFLVPFARFIHPYLKPANLDQPIPADEVTIYVIAAHILEKVVPLIENNDKAFISTVESDLLTLINRQGSPALIHVCIKTLCTLIQECSLNYGLVETLLAQCIVVVQSPQGKTKGDIVRCLFSIGLLIRYFNFEQRGFTTTTNTVIQPGQVVNHITPLIIRIFNYIKDPDIISKSLESVGNIIISSPVILNKDYIKEIISKAFNIGSSTSNTSSTSSTSNMVIQNQESLIRETIIKVFYDLLEKEFKSYQKDKPAVKKNEKKPKKPKKRKESDDDDDDDDDDDNDNSEDEDQDTEKKPIVSMQVDQNSESLVTAVQKYFPSMIKFLLDTNEMVRSGTISTIELIIKQGILNPLDSVPFIIALLTDPNPKISDKAYSTLLILNQKHTSSLFKRITECVQLTFRFHKSLDTKPPHHSVTRGISKFYSLFKSSKSNRTTFLNTLLSNFDTIKDYKYKELSYFKFIFEILACIPYANMDEIIVVINVIDKIVSLNANFIQSILQTYLIKATNASNNSSSTAPPTATIIDVVSETNIETETVKPVTRRGRKPAVSKTTTTTTTTEEQPIDLEEVYKNFIMIIVLILLLQLKQFLLKTYSINKEKMKSYLDSETKDSDKLTITYQDSINLTENTYPFLSLPLDQDLRSNLLVQKNLFSQLKTLLKEDDMDEFSIKTKKDTESKKRKPRAKPAAKPSAKSAPRRKKSKVSSSEESE
ncbi:hypothetical protein CYY_007442 [Polysphondylium violaceum]|uniref:Sister chromatid cohesion protein n=1 Tax=Polysphondylium violaceum TaxID=133409 RepID=A0A8J4PQY8_9MYCE|nr:hypothetical protein CYY_007442 [Polysphondylium violaceum]